jgi:hypothetical protein
MPKNYMSAVVVGSAEKTKQSQHGDDLLSIERKSGIVPLG